MCVGRPTRKGRGCSRSWTIANSNHRNHLSQTRAPHACLRRRNANAGHPEVLAAQRRERARIRSEKASGGVDAPSAQQPDQEPAIQAVGAPVTRAAHRTRHEVPRRRSDRFPSASDTRRRHRWESGARRRRNRPRRLGARRRRIVAAGSHCCGEASTRRRAQVGEHPRREVHGLLGAEVRGEVGCQRGAPICGDPPAAPPVWRSSSHASSLPRRIRGPSIVALRHPCPGLVVL